VHHILWDEFVKTPQLVAAGEEATLAALPRIEAALAGRIERRVGERRHGPARQSRGGMDRNWHR